MTDSTLMVLIQDLGDLVENITSFYENMAPGFMFLIMGLLISSSIIFTLYTIIKTFRWMKEQQNG